MVVRRLLATLVVASLLVSCSDDGPEADPPEPTSPTTSATVEPSPTETSTGPDIPPEAMGTDEASAKAFVKYWFRLVSESMLTGDTKAVRQFITDGCPQCRSVPDRIDSAFKNQQTVRSNGWTPLELRLEGPLSGGKVALFAKVRVARSEILDADNNVVDATPQRTMILYLSLIHADEAWAIRALEVVR